MNKIIKLCADYLKREGYAPKIDNENIIFKAEGKSYIIAGDENDEQFLRVLLPNFWEIESDVEMTKALRVANEVNSHIKVCKITIQFSNNQVWAVAEQFIDSTPDVDDFFHRTIRVLRLATEEFGKRMIARY